MFVVIKMLQSEVEWFPVFIAEVRRDVTRLSSKSEIYSHPWLLLAYELLRMVSECSSYRDVNSIRREYKNETVETRLQMFERAQE